MQLPLLGRVTSYLALREIRERGLLSAQRLEVYEALCRRGPQTGMELEAWLTPQGHARGHKHKRLSELARLGLVRERPARRCRVTGHMAVEWEALDQLPVEPVRRPTRLEAFADELRARLELEPGRTWTAAELADLLEEMSR